MYVVELYNFNLNAIKKNRMKYEIVGPLCKLWVSASNRSAAIGIAAKFGEVQKCCKEKA